MGILSRFVRVLKAKFSAIISAQEDPVEQLEYTFQQMLDKRRQMKRSVVRVKTQRKRLEKQRESFLDDVEKHNRQAEEAMAQDREDLARAALQRKKAKEAAVEDLGGQIDELSNIEEQMKEKLSEVEDRVEELRTKKEVLKARYEGAEAVESINEAMAEDLGEYSVEDAVGDIEEEIEEMQSRAEAINELEEEREQESVEDQLEELATDSEVESELETLRERDEPEIELEHEPDTKKLEKELAKE